MRRRTRDAIIERMQPTPADHDLYGLLGVHPGVSAEEIRLAYRQRAMIWHPDRNKRTDAEETFKRIRSAYDVLSDPSRRADYDRNLASRAERPSAERPESATQREPRAERAPDVRRRVHITLDEQFLLETNGLRPHQVRLEGGDASSDSYCYA